MTQWLSGTALVTMLSLVAPTAAQPPPRTAPDRAKVLEAAREVMQKARYATLVTLGEDGHPQARVVDPFVSAQVFMRYALNSSVGWSDEVSRLMIVWSIFLAIPLGIKLGVHIGIEMLTVRFSPRVQDSLGRVVALAGAALMALVCYEAAVITWDQWDEQMASVNVSAGLFILALALGCGHSALHLLWIALTGKPEADEEIAKELA